MINAMLPVGKLLSLKWKEGMGNQDLLVATYTTPDGEGKHGFDNGGWTVENAALQFLAGVGYKPSDIEGTYYDASDDDRTVVLARTPGGAWKVSEVVLSGGKHVLQQAAWFDGSQNT